MAIESFRLDGYDLVISSSHAVAKGAIAPPGALHVSYVHSPMRYIWEAARRRTRRRVPGGRARPRGVRRCSRTTCAGGTSPRRRASTRWSPTASTPRTRIRRCYGRDGAGHRAAGRRRAVRARPRPGRPRRASDAPMYLCVSALVPYKRVELAVRAFAGPPRRAWSSSASGAERARLARASPPAAERRAARARRRRRARSALRRLPRGRSTRRSTTSASSPSRRWRPGGRWWRSPAAARSTPCATARPACCSPSRRPSRWPRRSTGFERLRFDPGAAARRGAAVRSRASSSGASARSSTPAGATRDRPRGARRSMSSRRAPDAAAPDGGPGGARARQRRPPPRVRRTWRPRRASMAIERGAQLVLVLVRGADPGRGLVRALLVRRQRRRAAGVRDRSRPRRCGRRARWRASRRSARRSWARRTACGCGRPCRTSSRRRRGAAPGPGRGAHGDAGLGVASLARALPRPRARRVPRARAHRRRGQGQRDRRVAGAPSAGWPRCALDAAGRCPRWRWA